MGGKQTSGTCEFCRETLGNAAMTRHLGVCRAHKAAVEREQPKKGRRQNVFHIKVFAGPYWVHIEAAGSARLSDLDAFLRKLWLECCGHLSRFTIDRTDYDSDLEEGEAEEEAEWGRKVTHMRWPLTKVLKPGIAFTHDYDFGTTTRLALKVVSEREGAPKEKLCMMARNNPPELVCAKCEKPAKQVCSCCSWEKGNRAFFCAKCARGHRCADGEDYFLPVVNSPRSGMCGYTGDAW